ncbi:MAG: Crp/Fnr family transcriptional regulator [Granulosicoccus sp.]
MTSSGTNRRKPQAVTLSGFELFQDLTVDERSAIGQMCELRNYAAGQYVVKTGDQGDHVFFLVSGRVRACAFSDSGRQVHFEDLTAGQMFGELAVLDGDFRSSDCIVVDSANIISITRHNFSIIMSEHPVAMQFLLKRLATMVRQNMQKVYEFSSMGVNQRICMELTRMASLSSNLDPPIEIRDAPTHAEIATRVNAHREGVTRELKRLEREKIIVWKRERHAILDLVQLTDQAKV